MLPYIGLARQHVVCFGVMRPDRVNVSHNSILISQVVLTGNLSGGENNVRGNDLWHGVPGTEQRPSL